MTDGELAALLAARDEVRAAERRLSEARRRLRALVSQAVRTHGAREVARVLGVSRQRVHQMADRRGTGGCADRVDSSRPS